MILRILSTELAIIPKCRQTVELLCLDPGRLHHDQSDLIKGLLNGRLELVVIQTPCNQECARIPMQKCKLSGSRSTSYGTNCRGRQGQLQQQQQTFPNAQQQQRAPLQAERLRHGSRHYLDLGLTVLEKDFDV